MPRIWSAAFSPVIREGAFRLPLGMRGKIEESATLRPSTPMTLHSSSTTAKKCDDGLIDAIIADLKSVDFDGNGRIDADELQALLGKYNDTFSEGEILELTVIFYTSTGAASVEIYRFMEALDAAASDKSTSGGGETADGEVSPLAVKGAFKTHPLGIGTCASEYM